jgi:hypothetical protein
MNKFSVHVLDPAGKEVTEVKVNSKGGYQIVNIGSPYKTLWYMISG